MTIAILEFDINSFFPAKDGKGIDLDWDNNLSSPALSARNISSRGTVNVNNYGEIKTQINRLCPALGAKIKGLKAVHGTKGITLKWTTPAEYKNLGFDIEYATINNHTPQSKFSSVEHVPGKGMSTSKTSYAFNLSEIGEGDFIFRIRQIDENGSFEYSDAITVSIDKHGIPDVNNDFEMMLGMVP